MNKKIKVIELLNLLAENKIEKATKIKYGGTIYIVDFPYLCGIYPEGGTTKVSESLFSKINILSLNNEVEILENEEEIDIENLEEIKGIVAIDERGYITRETFEDFVNKINDLVKAVKKLDKNKVDYIQPYKED